MDCSDRSASPRRRLLAYAALLCGGVVAFLMLWAGPAQADGGQDPVADGDDSVLGLGQVGERVADTTRDLGATAGDTVRSATGTIAPARPAAPLVERATEQVKAGSDVVADQIQQTAQVADDLADRAVTQVVESAPDGPALPEPTPDQPAPTAPAPEGPAVPAPDTDPAPDRSEQRADDSERSEPAARHDVRPNERPTNPTADRLAGDAVLVGFPARSLPVDLTTPEADDSEPSRSAIPGPAALSGSPALLAGCDDCAGAASPTSGDPLHVLGLPSSGIATPRLADAAPPDAAGGGPSVNFARPDVSPD